MKYFNRYIVTVILFFTAITFFACRTVPETELPEIEFIEEIYLPPLTSLVFTSIEAESPDKLIIHFLLEIQNNYPVEIPAEINTWRVRINGTDAPVGFILDCRNEFIVGAAPDSIAVPMTLYMDVPVLADAGLAPEDYYEISLILELVLSDYSDALPGIEISGIAEFPGVQPPVFSISSIAVLQAELVNTLFRVGIVIDNPNPFAVNLDDFSYTLYGNDRLWADGSERNIISINAKTSLHGNIFLMMNFIDMGRSLFDQIVRLEDVNYRFTGEAVVITGVDYLPVFVSSFDLSGYSQVLNE